MLKVKPRKRIKPRYDINREIERVLRKHAKQLEPNTLHQHVIHELLLAAGFKPELVK